GDLRGDTLDFRNGPKECPVALLVSPEQEPVPIERDQPRHDGRDRLPFSPFPHEDRSKKPTFVFVFVFVACVEVVPRCERPRLRLRKEDSPRTETETHLVLGNVSELDKESRERWGDDT